MCRERTRCFVMKMAESRDRGEAVAAAACAKEGWPFRPQGRGREGLDCLGLVLVASAAAGARLEVPALPMLGHGRLDVFSRMRELGLREVELAVALPGDILLAFPATRQAHLGIRTAEGVVEANARVRRVVVRPWQDGAGWHSAWRLRWEQD